LRRYVYRVLRPGGGGREPGAYNTRLILTYNRRKIEWTRFD
jgi:hypothetical protein